MKIVLVCPLLLIASVALAATFKTQNDWSSQFLSEMAFTRKCSKVLGTYQWYCRRVSKEFVKKLDLVIVNTPADKKQIVYFESETQKILKNSRFQSYLILLRRHLNWLENDHIQVFDLYQVTSEFLGSSEKADDWIGLLFQDNNFPFHRTWVKNQTFLPEKLRDAYLTIYDRLSKEGNSKYSKIYFYPHEVQSRYAKNFSDKIYYYFLPKILQKKLRTMPSPDNLNSAQAQEFRRVINSYSMMVTLIYMYHHFYGGIFPGYQLDPVSLGNWDGSHFISNGTLEKFKNDKSVWINRYRDLYMTYVAGFTELNSNQPADFQEFAIAFWENPLAAIKQYSY